VRQMVHECRKAKAKNIQDTKKAIATCRRAVQLAAVRPKRTALLAAAAVCVVATHRARRKVEKRQKACPAQQIKSNL
jgi:hypothetical protein